MLSLPDFVTSFITKGVNALQCQQRTIGSDLEADKDTFLAEIAVASV